MFVSVSSRCLLAVSAVASATRTAASSSSCSVARRPFLATTASSSAARRCAPLALRAHFSSTPPPPVTANRLKYAQPLTGRPIVGICLDGSQQEYIDEALAAGLMPNWHAIIHRAEEPGYHALSAAVMPTFTNPNNVAIMCGAPPNVTGICGNFYYDPERDEEVMMNDAALLRGESIFAAQSQAGTRVTVVTTKNKLLDLLSVGLDPQHSIGVSVEDNMWAATQERVNPLLPTLLPSTAADASPPTLLSLMDGVAPPPIYSAEASLYCLRLGAALVRERLRCGGADGQRDLFYLSTTDYLQHKTPPGSDEANAFYAAFDTVLGELEAAGAAVGVTADHGMNDKVGYDNTPKVVFAESELAAVGIVARCILPITDPYTVHHGSLGGFATVYMSDSTQTAEAMATLRALPGIYTVMGRDDAVRAFELPSDRIGDFVIVGDKNTVVGRTPDYHDLDAVTGLRSHGALEEAVVPMMVSRPLTPAYKKKLGSGRSRNFHLYDFLCNGLA